MSSAIRWLPRILVACVYFLARTAHAQGTVLGVVEDSTGAAISLATVIVAGSNFGVATDANGRFRFPSLPAKAWKLEVRRLGYAPVTTEIEVRNRDTLLLSITLIPSAVTIAPVVVTETDITPRLRAVGFEQRRKLLTTVPARQFVTRAQIEKRNPIKLSQLLEHIGGRARGCTNPVMYVDGGRLTSAPVDPPVPPRAQPTPSSSTSGRRSVSAPVNTGSFSPGMARPLPVDEIPPSWIEGLEIYVGFAQIPLEYRPAGRDISCVLLIWTRSGS